MRTGLAFLLGACLFAAAPAFAQSPLALPDVKALPSPVEGLQPEEGPAPKKDAPPPLDAPPADTGLATPTVIEEPYRMWGRAEYLMFWVKNAPTPIGLVTGSDPTNPTQPVFGSNQRFGDFSGMRFDLGSWLDSANTVGVEGTFFLLQRGSATMGAASNGSGSPTLQFPFINQSPGAVGNTLFPVAYPGIFAGSVNVQSTLDLWGAEANGVFVLIPRQAGFELTAIAGFRYVDLSESLSINTMSSDILTSPNTVLAQTDQFSTRNQFYGGQLGARLNLEAERFSFDMTAKVALGLTQQTLDIQGASTQTGPGGVNGAFPGGFFTQQSNIGQHTANQFGVIPEIELKLHYFFTPRISAFVGYDFMYWNSVIRPGNQIDRNINLTQSNVLGMGALNGPAFPAQQFTHSDFWAQGVTLGFEFRY